MSDGSGAFLGTWPGGLLTASLAILVMASLHPTPPAAALSATSSVESRIRLDWEVRTRHGRPVIQGYVYNDYFRAAANVRLLVETLDASGAVIARDVGVVRGVVAFNDRTYCEVPLTTPGASYHVSITAFDWRTRRGEHRRFLAGCQRTHPAFARGEGPPASVVLPRCYQNARYQAYPGRHSAMLRAYFA